MVGFVWVVNFKIHLRNRHESFDFKEKSLKSAITFKRLSPIFSIFIDWILTQDNYPELGFICSININRSYLDENDNLLCGKILNDLRESYLLSNSKTKEVTNG
jgi:hypothetical protein